MAELIQRDDSLNTGREKLNEAIKASNRAEGKSDYAVETADTALNNSESTQTQLDTIVIDGDSSVEAAQARVDEKGVSHTTLKARIDDGMNSVNQQLAQIPQQINEAVEPKADKIYVDDKLTGKTNYSEVRLVSRKLELEDMSPATLSAIAGGEGTEFNLLSIPQPKSVDYDRFAKDEFNDNLIYMRKILENLEFVPGNNYFDTPLEKYANNYWQINGFSSSDSYSCYVFKLRAGTYILRGYVRHVWVYDKYPIIGGREPVQRVRDTSHNGETTITVDHDFYLMVNMFNNSSYYVLQKGSTLVPVVEDKSILNELKGSPNPLHGKTLLNFGDSIAEGNADRDENGVDIGYSNRIGQRNNMNVYNRAKGGATITPREGTTNDIINQINQAISDNIDADYILFNGLTNDTLGDYNIPLGEIESGYNADFDLITFSGAFQEVCKLIKTNWLQAKIIYIRPFNMGGRNDVSQVEFGERALEICRKWSIPYIDMFNEGGLNTKLSQHVGLYTPEDDPVHPNGLGYEMYYVPKIEAKMKSV